MIFEAKLVRQRENAKLAEHMAIMSQVVGAMLDKDMAKALKKSLKDLTHVDS